MTAATEDASWSLQVAVVAYLAGLDAVQAVLGKDKTRIFDDVPEDAAFPYAVIGEDDEENVGGDGMPGSGHSLTITVFSQDVGFKESKAIAGVLRRSLENMRVPVPGFDVIRFSWVNTQHRRHPDQAALRMSGLRFATELRPII